MKRSNLLILSILGILIFPFITFAQSTTLQDETSGQNIWTQLQSNQISCSNLKDSQFEVLGEYFMGQMMGQAHDAMNQRMVQVLGQNGEEQMHIAMGKRFSGCNPNAAYPAGNMFIPMMSMMGGWSPSNNLQNYNSMMGFGYSPMGWFGGFFMIFWWIFLIVIVVAAIRLIIGPGRHHRWNRENSALDFLKERYAKGEINKQEFEDKKKDLM